MSNHPSIETSPGLAAPQAGRGLGIVVIGRNEGARLIRCLESCAREAAPVVYVDSGSTDGSQDAAARAGATVVALDMSIPFTAARARNAGLATIVRRHPELACVQFLDGDCELLPGWTAAGLGFLATHPGAIAVSGRCMERHPEASIYNRLCDIEWNPPPGQANAFGGNVMIRTEPLRAAGGFREDLIAGEEPELAVRLRRAGWTIWRLADDMVWHDAAMTRWMQWWRRSVRTGHAFAEGADLHGKSPERHYVAETRRALLWGALIPLALIVAISFDVRAAWCLLVYPAQWARVAWKLRRGHQPLPALRSAFFLQARFAEAVGVLRYWWGRARRAPSALIEYK